MNNYVFISSAVLKCNYLNKGEVYTYVECDEDGDLIRLPKNIVLELLKIESNITESVNKFDENIIKIEFDATMETNTYKLDFILVYVYKVKSEYENRFNYFLDECTGTIERNLYQYIYKIIDSFEGDISSFREKFYDVISNSVRKSISQAIERKNKEDNLH